MKSEVVNKEPNAAVVSYENPWLEAAAETGNELGRLLKFVKGKYETGDDEVPEGTEYVAHIDQLVRGWVKFEDNKVVEQHLAKWPTASEFRRATSCLTPIPRNGQRTGARSRAILGLRNGICRLSISKAANWSPS